MNFIKKLFRKFTRTKENLPVYSPDEKNELKFRTETISIHHDMMAPSVPGTGTYGSFRICVADTNVFGAIAIFDAVRSANPNEPGRIIRISSCPGQYGESLNILWNPNDFPRIYFFEPPSNGNGSLMQYKTYIQRYF